MARILLLTPQLPFPAHQGTSLRNYHILKWLVQNHKVDLLTFGPDRPLSGFPKQIEDCNEIRTVPMTKRTTKDRVIGLTNRQIPDLAQRLQSASFDQTLKQMLTGGSNGQGAVYDIVQVEGLELAQTIPLIKRISPTSRIVFDSHNAETELQRRTYEADRSKARRWPAAAYSYLQINRLREFERWVCESADWVTVVSDQDHVHLKNLAPAASITVIPNCIDVSEYSDFPGAPFTSYDLVFTGKMDYRPNVDAVIWFEEEIWPLVKKHDPAISWAVVGQKPHPRLNCLQDDPNITITGWVDTVLPYLAGATLFIMPFRIGSGTRLKLIEAMAAGKAIVSTHVGAEGFNVQHGEQLYLADDPVEFAAFVVELLADAEERARLGQAAQRFAQQYDWRLIVPRFEDIYKKLLG